MFVAGISIGFIVRISVMATISEALAIAVQHHMAGRLRAAEVIYRQILQAEPNQADALHLLGVIADQMGKHGIAVEMIGRAIALNGTAFAFHNSLGNALVAQGSLEDAVACYRRALELQPDSVEAHYNLGNSLKNLGNLEEAVVCYRRALALKPDYAEAHNNLGIALQTQGQLPEAVASHNRALALKPDLVEAHINLGMALKNQGTLEEAVACHKRALALAPDCAAAHNNLGIALAELGKSDEAIACYQQALRLQPDYVEAHNNLGIALVEREAFDEGIASYRQALRLKPDFAQAYNNLGAAFKDPAQFDEAIDCYRQALQLQPDYAEAHANLGIALRDQGNLEAATTCFHEALRFQPDLGLAWWYLGQLVDFSSADIGRLQTLLASSQRGRRNQSDLHRTLAVWLERRQDYQAAFSHFRQANDLMKQELRQTRRDFDPELLRALIDRQIATFDEAFFQQRRPAGSTTEVPIFVVGMPRSGTTLVEQILSSHSGVVGAGELPFVGQLVNFVARTGASLGGYPGCLPALELANLQELANRYLARLEPIDGSAVRVIDKMPGNLLHLGFIALLFPQARVIHCCRDPLDVCLSCYFQNLSRITCSWSLEDLGFCHREYERMMAHWRQVLPMRMIEVRYEDLVRRQETVSRELVAFCGLEWEERCAAFYQNTRPVHTASALQVRQPIYSTSIGRWRHYEAYLEPLRQALAVVPVG